MSKADEYLYHDMKNILEYGFIDENPRPKYADGKPAHTISVNQVLRKYDLSKGEFPICSLRPIAWKSAIKEILWIYQDQTSSLNLLKEKYNVKYWDEWESYDKPNTIGQRYGATVHRYHLIDKLLKDIKEDPYGRRKIMNLWQEHDLEETDGLAPCAFLTMWNVRNYKGQKYLDMTLIQRSGDMLVASGGGGVNEVQYAALLLMVARHCDLLPGVFCHFVQNEQIYDRHIEQANELESRYERIKNIDVTPMLKLNYSVKDFYDFEIEDFEMVNYNPIKPQMKFELGI